MADIEFVQDLIKLGVGGAVLLAIFWKFIPTLFEFLRTRQETSDGCPCQHHVESNKRGIARNEKRLDEVEHDLRKTFESIASIRTTIEVSQAILARIEAKINDK